MVATTQSPTQSPRQSESRAEGVSRKLIPDHTMLFYGYLIGAAVTIAGGLVEGAIGIDAEGRSLEDLATALRRRIRKPPPGPSGSLAIPVRRGDSWTSESPAVKLGAAQARATA